MSRIYPPDSFASDHSAVSYVTPGHPAGGDHREASKWRGWRRAGTCRTGSAGLRTYVRTASPGQSYSSGCRSAINKKSRGALPSVFRPKYLNEMRIRSAIMKIARRTWFELQQPVARLTADAPAPPTVTAKSVYAMHSATLHPLFAKNPNVKLPPASLTKLATSILLSRVSRHRWHETIQIEREDVVGGSTMGVAAGELVTRRDLLFGMLGPSGNDASMAAARLIGTRWCDDMNQLAAELGMTRTRFVNPHGRDTRGQYSTARDLARLAAAAFSDPDIGEAAAMRSYSFNGREIRSTVTMLGESGVSAGKTGSTLQAGGCLALAYREYIIVILGSAVQFDAAVYPIAATDRRYDDARRIISAI